MGQCLSKISTECGVARDDMAKLSSGMIKEKMRYFSVPEEQTWRTDILNELLNNEIAVEGFTDVEKQDMISFLCTT